MDLIKDRKPVTTFAKQEKIQARNARNIANRLNIGIVFPELRMRFITASEWQIIVNEIQKKKEIKSGAKKIAIEYGVSSSYVYMRIKALNLPKKEEYTAQEKFLIMGR